MEKGFPGWGFGLRGVWTFLVLVHVNQFDRRDKIFEDGNVMLIDFWLHDWKTLSIVSILEKWYSKLFNHHTNNIEDFSIR